MILDTDSQCHYLETSSMYQCWCSLRRLQQTADSPRFHVNNHPQFQAAKPNKNSSQMLAASQLLSGSRILRNGEMCKVSFFKLGSTPYLALGSKNVTLVASVANKERALADLKAYEEERYQFAVEMAEVFLEAGRFLKDNPFFRLCPFVFFCMVRKQFLGGYISLP